MSNARRFIQLPTRRARRGGAMLLIVVWTMLQVFQAYAACCGPHGGTPHQFMKPVMEVHAIVQSEHERCNDPQAPCCAQMLDEKRSIAGVLSAVVDDGRLTQPALLQRSLPMLFEPHHTGNDRVPDSPGPPDRMYLRLRRFLI